MENFRNNRFSIYKLDRLKEWYLEELEEEGFAENTILCVKNLMNRIRFFEITIMDDKNIADFTYEDFVSFLKVLGSSSEYSLQVQFANLKKFVEFGIIKNQISPNAPYLSIFNEGYHKYLDKDKNSMKYPTKREVYEFVDTLQNNIDKALLLLVWEGIRGNKNSEIINLKKENLNGDCTVELFDEDGNIRVKEISEKLQELLILTCGDEIYYTKNGSTEFSNREADLFVENSDYVFRPTKHYLLTPPVQAMIDTGEYEGDKLNECTVSSKLTRCLREYCNASFITPITLYYAGLMWRFLEQYLDDGAVEKPSRALFFEYSEKEGLTKINAYKIYKLIDIILPKYVEEREFMSN